MKKVLCVVSRNFLKVSLTLLYLFFSLGVTNAQKAYFIDGFHGGVWGHYPKGYTSFIVEQLQLHPDWKLNLEIEPVTWDRVEALDADAYQTFKRLFSDQSFTGRLEYVNPSYAQSYLWNISGESMIRQFSYGIKELRSHFPDAVFATYSSEEPCFTSALPQILKSFGLQYASLKNPNTCWGGYTRAFGGELVNWVGPDGTKILTVPRYEVELLKPHSTWETIGNANSKKYIESAFDYGIQHPIGMCLQDAGWRLGPWLSKRNHYKPTRYMTWKDYFANVADTSHAIDWKFSQEDILVSLVWGSQVLQDVAQEVRQAENKVIQAEKIATMRYLGRGVAYPYKVFDTAWQALLLSQHHDCWIVPYNTKGDETWAEKVKEWTSFTVDGSDSIMMASHNSSMGNQATVFVKVFNTTGKARTEWVRLVLPPGWDPSGYVLVDKEGNSMPSQVISSDNKTGGLLFKASVPSFGYRVFRLKKGTPEKWKGASVRVLKNGNYLLETDYYKLILDPEHGGVISHLIAKKLNHKEFVDQSAIRKFNELRGNFYKEGGFQSSASHPASIKVMENGPARVKVAVEGTISGNPYTQLLTLTQGQKRIDLRLIIDWKEQEGIGAFEEKNYEATNLRKAFYNDRYKLSALFPLNLENQKVYKNAPFDVTKSRLDNTFFSTWDSIKNNIILNWVDVTDGKGAYGCALYSDHTTSYSHGTNFPLGLTVQYAGKGLWGRNYTITHPTDIHYALIPHEGNWEQADLWKEGRSVREPLITVMTNKRPERDSWQRSFLNLRGEGLVLTAGYLKEGKMNLRLFNTGASGEAVIQLGFVPQQAALIQLNGDTIKPLPVRKGKYDSHLSVSIPQFGIRTIQLNLF